MTGFKATFEGMHQADWQRTDDYDPEGADWVESYLMGSNFHKQVDLRKEGHVRHRHIPTMGPWVKGEPGDHPADELEFLRFFYIHADFGPADDEVRGNIIDVFREETGKDLPEGH